MIDPTDWEPSPADIAWQEGWLRLLVSGKRAVWGVPCSTSVFEVDKREKTFRLLEGSPSDETNKRIAVVFIRMGYREVEDTPKTAKSPVNRVKDFYEGQQ